MGDIFIVQYEQYFNRYKNIDLTVCNIDKKTKKIF